MRRSSAAWRIAPSTSSPTISPRTDGRPDGARPPPPVGCAADAGHGAAAPRGAGPARRILADVESLVLPYPMGNASPRFFGWVNSPPAPMGVIGELLAAGMDPSVAGGDHAATYVEHAALRWIVDLLGLPPGSGAVLCSGGSVANLIGLAVMRSVHAPGVRATGLRDGPPLVVYTSIEGHSCIEKAVEILGLGHDHLRRLPVDVERRLDVGALRAASRPTSPPASSGPLRPATARPVKQRRSTRSPRSPDVCAAGALLDPRDGAYAASGSWGADRRRDGLYAGPRAGRTPRRRPPQMAGDPASAERGPRRVGGDAGHLHLGPPYCATTRRCPGSASSGSSRLAAPGPQV